MRIVILGNGLSGLMMAQRLLRDLPEADIKIIGDGKGTIHPFHLHRPIDLSGLDNIKPVKIRTQTWDGKTFKDTPSTKDINHYALKVFGNLQSTNEGTPTGQEIYPCSKDRAMAALHKNLGGDNFIEGKVHTINIISNKVFYESPIFSNLCYDYLISTIPLPDLCTMSGVDLKKKDIYFENFPFYSSMIDLRYSTNMYQMIYVASDNNSITRLTLLDDKIFIESERDTYSGRDRDLIDTLFGNPLAELPELKKLHPGRIKPLPSEKRKPLLHWLTEKHNIFCLGRYGCWNHKVANDVWEDTAFISHLIYAKVQAARWEDGE